MRRGLIAAVLLLFGGHVSAQVVIVRLINGENGRPVGGKNVTIRWDSGLFPEIVVPIDKKGMGRFPVGAGTNYFSIEGGPRVGKEPYRVALIECNAKGDTWKVSIKEVMEKGFVPGNVCSKKVSASAKPGEVVFFAKPIPWWRSDMQ